MALLPRRLRAPLSSLVLVAALWIAPAAHAAVFVDRGNPACSDRTVAEATVLTPWCSFAKLRTVPPGETVIVRPGNYPKLLIKDQRNAATVTVRGEGSPTIAGIDMRRSSNWRFEGLHLTATLLIADGSNGIGFAQGEIGPASQGVDLKGSRIYGPVTDVLIEDTHIHDITDNGNGSTGYGVRASAGGVNYVTVRRSLIERTTGDGIQTSGVDGLVIEGNEIRDARKRRGSNMHTDSIQIMKPGGSMSARIVGNFIHDNQHPVMIFGRQRGLVMEDNVITRIGSYCTQIIGAPSAVIVNNVFSDCGIPYVRISDSDGRNSAADRTPARSDNVVFLDNSYPGLTGGAQYAAKTPSGMSAHVGLGMYGPLIVAR
jgi:hypothetical protein